MALLEAQGVLAPALSLTDAEAANHYFQVVNQWYQQGNASAFKAFLHNEHIPRITKLLHSRDGKIALDAIRTLALLAASPRVHQQMLDCRMLLYMVQILGSSTKAAQCEAALVVLNHLCTQKPEKRRYSQITEFCKEDDSLTVIFRYAHVEDSSRSLLANVFSLLAQLCNKRGTEPLIERVSV